MKSPIKHQIGKYEVVGENSKDGCVFCTEGLKLFLNIPLDKITEKHITDLIMEYRLHETYTSSAVTTEQKSLYTSILGDYTMKSPSKRQIGKYEVVGENTKDGCVFYTGELKLFLNMSLDQIVEKYITDLITGYNSHKARLEKEQEKENAKREAERKIAEEKEKIKREAERKIAEEKEAQTNEHVALIASALKKNPAILSIVLKEYPEILQQTLSKILPDILHTELQDFRKELSSSLHTKLPDILRSMMGE
jgi:hypothetical protein